MKKTISVIIFASCAIIFTSCEKAPVPCFTADKTNVYINTVITFTDCSTRDKKFQLDKGIPAIYTWDFGDSNSGSGASVTHAYSKPGAYTVTLTVQDEDKDRTATTTQSVTITNPPLVSDIKRSGKFLAFTSNNDGDYDIYIAQVDSATGAFASSGLIFSSNPFNLTTSFNNDSDKQANWSPDGKALLFSSTQSNTQENIYAFFFNADGSLVSSTPTLIISKTNAWDENPFFSPDGKKIIFDRRTDVTGDGIIDNSDSRDLMLADVTLGASSITVNDTVHLTSTTGTDEYNAKWSPKISVQRIAYEYAGSATSTDHDIYIMDPLNTSTDCDWNNPGSSGYPAWSPNCVSIIFESNSGNGGFYKIVSSGFNNSCPNSGTTDIIKSPNKNLRYPTWVPNGNFVAYIQQSSTSKGNIYVIPSTGGTATKLLPASFDNSDNSYPAW